MDNLKIELRQWLKMVTDNDAITGIYRAIVCDGKNIGSISVEKKDVRSEGQVFDFFVKRSITCPRDLHP